jgi:hypothetical protein
VITAEQSKLLRLSPTGRQLLPNGASQDVGRVLKAHGYKIEALELLNALRGLIADTKSANAKDGRVT